MPIPIRVLFSYQEVLFMQQCLYFSPLPQGQGSLRPGASAIMIERVGPKDRALVCWVNQEEASSRFLSAVRNCVRPAGFRWRACPKYWNDSSARVP